MVYSNNLLIILVILQISGCFSQLVSQQSNENYLKNISPDYQQIQYDRMFANTSRGLAIMCIFALIFYWMTFKKGIKNELRNQRQQIANSIIKDMEIRDRHLIIEMSPPKGKLLANGEIQSWTTEMCTKIFSVAFNYYVSGNLTFENTKIFCSEGILLNILHSAQKYHFSSNQILAIDDLLQQKIIPYLQKKYPLTEEAVLNRAIQAKIENIDNLQNLANDFLHNGGLHFPISSTGYNDKIMRAINLALTQMNEYSPKVIDGKKITHFQDFQNEMIKVFEKPENLFQVLSLANGLQISQIAQKQVEQYKQNVKKYTHFLIGRKLNENIEPFSQKDIKNGNIQIRHPSILRFLIKWVEQLQEIFQDPTYIFEKIDQINNSETSDINILTENKKILISQLLNLQWKKIEKQRKALFESLYSQQAYHFNNNMKPDDIIHLAKYEKGMGKQAIQTSKMLHHYIILLLNCLIHGLNIVTKSVFKQMPAEEYQESRAPPNLVILNIGDLMRCRCQSQQKQILIIFNTLKEISNNNAEKLKIIRVKNRLRKSTNDILINVKYNNLIVGEIQLAVKKKQSDFIICSNKFSHYLYELQRTIFGPISQFCSIWSSLDPRAQQFITIVESSQKKRLARKQLQTKNIQNGCIHGVHFYLPYAYPSQCNFCHNSYYHNRYLLQIQKCKKCQMVKCCWCRLATLDSTQIKRIFLGEQYYQLQNEQINHQHDFIPDSGILTKIQSYYPSPKFFIKIQGQGKKYLVTNQNERPKMLLNFQTEIQQRDLLDKYCIFSYKDAKKILNFNVDTIATFFLTRHYIQKCTVSQRSILSLNNKQISNQQLFLEYFDTQDKREYCKKIKILQIGSNSIDDATFLVEYFPNLAHLQFDKNPIQNLSSICNLPQLNTIIGRNLPVTILKIPLSIRKLNKLQMINFSFNKITQIPKEFCQLTQLKSLILKNNYLVQIPQDFDHLQELKVLKLKGNKSLGKISQKICNLTKLEVLNMNLCTIKQIPYSIKNLTQLRILLLSNNNIDHLPMEIQIYQSLSKLIDLTLDHNQLTSIPRVLGDLPKIKNISFEKNKIVQFALNQNHSLQKLNLNNNSLKRIDKLQNYTNLSQLLLAYNQLSTLSDTNTISRLTKLNLAGNSFTQIGQEILRLQKLYYLNLSQNIIQVIPERISKALINLKQLLLNINKIKVIPNTFSELKLNKLNISHNKLTELQKQSLNKFHQMETFDASFNLITAIPCVYFTHIVHICLDNNKISQLDFNIQEESPTIIISLKNNQIETIPLEIFKLEKLVKIDLTSNNIKEKLNDNEHLIIVLDHNPKDKKKKVRRNQPMNQQKDPE